MGRPCLSLHNVEQLSRIACRGECQEGDGVLPGNRRVLGVINAACSRVWRSWANANAQHRSMEQPKNFRPTKCLYGRNSPQGESMVWALRRKSLGVGASQCGEGPSHGADGCMWRRAMTAEQKRLRAKFNKDKRAVFCTLHQSQCVWASGKRTGRGLGLACFMDSLSAGGSHTELRTCTDTGGA